MEVQVIVGVLEKYEPSEKIKEIHEKARILREKMSKFMEEVAEPEIISINKAIDEENSKFIDSNDKIE